MHPPDAPRICTTCDIPHIENCRDCYGWGVYDPAVVKSELPKGLPVRAVDAHEPKGLWGACPPLPDLRERAGRVERVTVSLSPDELRALGYDPEASARTGRAVRIEHAPRTTRTRQPRPWAPYRSKWEYLYAQHLALLVTVGRLAHWTYEPDTLVCAGGTRYTPDFRVRYPDGREEYREVKGYFRKSDRVRVREALAVSPLPLVLVTRKGGAWVSTTLPRPHA